MHTLSVPVHGSKAAEHQTRFARRGLIQLLVLLRKHNILWHELFRIQNLLCGHGIPEHAHLHLPRARVPTSSSTWYVYVGIHSVVRPVSIGED